MCCGKNKNNGAGKSPASFSLNQNYASLLQGTMTSTTYLIYQSYEKGKFRGFDGRMYAVKGKDTCLEVDVRDEAHLLAQRRNGKKPFFRKDTTGICQSVNNDILEEAVAIVLTEEEKTANPLEGETLQQDMYPDDANINFAEPDNLVENPNYGILTEPELSNNDVLFVGEGLTLEDAGNIGINSFLYEPQSLQVVGDSIEVVEPVVKTRKKKGIGNA